MCQPHQAVRTALPPPVNPQRPPPADQSNWAPTPATHCCSLCCRSVAMADVASMEFSGLAWVSFPSAEEAAAASAKHKDVMGARYIEILPATTKGALGGCVRVVLPRLLPAATSRPCLRWSGVPAPCSCTEALTTKGGVLYSAWGCHTHSPAHSPAPGASAPAPARLTPPVQAAWGTAACLHCQFGTVTGTEHRNRNRNTGPVIGTECPTPPVQATWRTAACWHCVASPSVQAQRTSVIGSTRTPPTWASPPSRQTGGAGTSGQCPSLADAMMTQALGL